MSLGALIVTAHHLQPCIITITATEMNNIEIMLQGLLMQCLVDLSPICTPLGVVILICPITMELITNTNFKLFLWRDRIMCIEHPQHKPRRIRC